MPLVFISARPDGLRPIAVLRSDTVEEALDFLAGLVPRAPVAFLDLSGEDFGVALDLHCPCRMSLFIDHSDSSMKFGSMGRTCILRAHAPRASSRTVGVEESPSRACRYYKACHSCTRGGRRRARTIRARAGIVVAVNGVAARHQQDGQ